jgi:two-component system, cell cycle sensor histidine kinase and response regulator CckA
MHIHKIFCAVNGFGNHFHSGWRYLLVLPLAICLCCVGATPAGAEAGRNVLILQSYHMGYPWSDSVTKGILSVFEKEKHMALFFEYMDTKRHMDKPYLEKLFQFYKEKYGEITLNVIICSDDNALNFLLKNRSALFPGVPIVFCGINNFSDAAISGQADITGVVENPDVRGTLEIALRLHPKARHVAAVFDQTRTGQANGERLKKIAPDFENRVDFTYLTDMTISQLGAALRALPPDTVVLQLAFAKDRDGVFMSQWEANKLVNDNSKGPVYTLWEVRMAYPGHMGGKMVSGYAQGEIAAGMAVRILQGESAGSIPIIRESPNVYIFDSVQMNRFGLNNKDLPKDSIIVNEPFSFYETYQKGIWFVSGTFILLLILILFLMANISKRRRAEKRSKESEERYRKLFQSASDAVFLVDVESMNVLDVNEAAVELYGYPYDKLVKMKVPELSAEPTESETALKQLRPTVIPIRYHRKKDDTVFPVEITANYFDLDGRKINISAIRDVSQRIEYEKEKELLETQLRQSHKMESIGNLAGGIAHDFNNILSVVIGYTELSLDDVEKGTHMEDQLQKVYMAGKRAKDLVKQILAFARQSGEEIKPMRVDAITKEVLKFLRSSIPVTIEINQKIESESLIMGNATQVHQVLMNLCTNAAHAMEDAGGMLQVGLKDVLIDDRFHVTGRELKPGYYLKLTVSDTGTGIAPDVMETIFDPYFTTKGPGEGSGLGLAVVHGIVETYGGTVSVESVLGKGTVFSIYLPVAEKQEIHHEIASEPLSSGTERILFVDDELPIADAGGQILERLGYSVTTMTSSVEALELFRSKPDDFDLVITDMTMPTMTGDMLSVELMKIRPGIPVILCTGYSKKITDKAASAMGIKGFAYKPIVKADLARTVRRVLDEGED